MTKKMGDFIIIPRRIFNIGAFGKQEPFTKREAFLDLVQMAAFDKTEFSINGYRYNVERGQVAISKGLLAKRWGWNVDKVRRYMSYLMREGWCYYKCDHQCNQPITLVSIVNYDAYQGGTTTPTTTCDTTPATTSTTTPATINNNKKNNNNNNEKKTSNDVKENPKHFVPPTVDEVRAYCSEKGYTIDANYFVNYYKSKGWVVGKSPMKDWRAAVANWNAKDKKANDGNIFQQQPTPPPAPKKEPMCKVTISSGGFGF